jgi:alpha-beta hydrolase superfamily lysophospholipase
MYRVALLPFVAAVIAALTVYAGTHPSIPAIERDPITVGVYYDPVVFVTRDDRRLEGWLAPVLDARTVIEQQDKVFGSKYPAVVLVHDHGNSREQMLPLVRPLHEAGYVVLTIGLRGDEPMRSSGSTFGLNESLDVAAAVELLRRRPFVDPSRIGVLGVGSGATAAALAAEQDSNVRTLIALRPPPGVDDLLYHHVVPERLPWLGSLCRWTFEIAYGVNTGDAATDRLAATLDRPSTLVLRKVGGMDDTTMNEKIVDHLFHHLLRQQTATVAGH